MRYLGDFVKGATVRFAWNSHGADGASITRATNGTIYVYKDGALATEVTTGVTDTEDADTLTGVHLVQIVTTDAFYAAGSEFEVILKAATIDGKVVNATLAQFSLNRRTAMTPYVGIVATATSTTLLTLPAECPAVADALTGMMFVPIYGAGKDQAARYISAYSVGRVATLDPPLTTAVDNATSFMIVRSAPSAVADYTAIADVYLDRDMSAGVDSGSTTVRTPRQALRALRNKVSVTAGTATITKEDDATASWTAAVTGTPTVTAVDPAGP